jgi:hypothetical protein
MMIFDMKKINLAATAERNTRETIQNKGPSTKESKSMSSSPPPRMTTTGQSDVSRHKRRIPLCPGAEFIIMN